MMIQCSLPTVEITEASLEDMAAIEEIYSYYVNNTLVSMEEISPSQEELNHRRLSYQAHGLPYIVAKWEGEVIGYAYAAPYRPRSGYRFTVENSVYINPSHRGKGVGSLLLGEIISRCKAQGCRQVIAVIAKLENSPSVQLHAKLGFTVSGILHGVGFKFGQRIDTIVMQRSLED